MFSMCFILISSSLDEYRKFIGTTVESYCKSSKLRLIPCFYLIFSTKASANTLEINSGMCVFLEIIYVAMVLNEQNGESATTYLMFSIIWHPFNLCSSLRQVTAPMDLPHRMIFLKPLFMRYLTMSSALLIAYIVPKIIKVRS
jgi:hypothetical protein